MHLLYSPKYFVALNFHEKLQNRNFSFIFHELFR